MGTVLWNQSTKELRSGDMTNLKDLLQESLGDPIQLAKSRAAAAIREQKRLAIVKELSCVPEELQEVVKEHAWIDEKGYVSIDLPGHHRIRPCGDHFHAYAKPDVGTRHDTFGEALLAAEIPKPAKKVDWVSIVVGTLCGLFVLVVLAGLGAVLYEATGPLFVWRQGVQSLPAQKTH
jgi:hypothetical protein